MTSNRHVVISEADLKLLSHPAADYRTRSAIVGAIIEDAPSDAEIAADSLVEAAEVLKERMDKRVQGMVGVDGAFSATAGESLSKLFGYSQRAIAALTVEHIIYRWLMARSEAVRAR